MELGTDHTLLADTRIQPSGSQAPLAVPGLWWGGRWGGGGPLRVAAETPPWRTNWNIFFWRDSELTCLLTSLMKRSPPPPSVPRRHAVTLRLRRSGVGACFSGRNRLLTIIPGIGCSI